jgi:hypothetical protein
MSQDVYCPVCGRIIDPETKHDLEYCWQNINQDIYMDHELGAPQYVQDGAWAYRACLVRLIECKKQGMEQEDKMLNRGKYNPL